ncbi:MAG: SEL1-like repeat protein [Nitratireductor sp.]
MAPRPTSQTSGRDISRIREGIDALSEKLAALNNTHAAPTRADPPGVTPDLIDGLGRDLRNEFARMRDELGSAIQSVGHSLNQTIANSNAQMRADPRRDDMLAEELLRISDGITRLQNGGGGEPAFLEEIAAELHTMREELGIIASHGSPQVDLGGVARSIESGYSDIAARLEETVATAIRNGADSAHGNETISHIITLSDHVTAIRDRIEGMSLEAIQSHVEELSGVVNALSGQGDKSLAFNFSTINDRLDEITRALVAVSINPPGGLDALDRIEARMTSLSKAIDRIAEENTAISIPAQALENGLAELGQKFDLFAQHALHREDNGGHDSLTSRLDEIVQQLEAMADSGAHASSPALDGIGQGLDALSAKLDRLAENGMQAAELDATGILGSRLDEIADHLAQLTVANANSNPFSVAQEGNIDHDGSFQASNVEAVLSVIESQLIAIFDRLPEPGSANPALQSDNSEIMQMLSVLSERIEQAGHAQPAALPDSAQLAALEHQLAGIAAHLTTIGDTGFDLAPLNERLENIESQVANSRDIVMDAAVAAAERAASLVAGNTSETGQSTNNDVIDQLAAELRSLEENTRHLTEMHAQSFDTVRETMTMISDRLGDIENHLQSASNGSPRSSRDYRETRVSHEDAGGYAPAASRQPQHEPEYASSRSSVAGLQHGMAGGYRGDAMEDDLPPSSYRSSFDSDRNERHPFHDDRDDLPSMDDAPRLHIDDLPEMDGANSVGHDVPLGDYDNHDYNSGDVQDPASESHSVPEDDVPLEPGSGVPDLEALMRQATARRRGGQQAAAPQTATSDLIAQKRREAQAAAQAAAQMAAAAAAQEATKGGKPEKSKTGKSALSGVGGLGKIGSLLAGRKKMLMGGAAILLLAALAGPLASMFIGSGDQETVVIGQTDATSDPLQSQEQAALATADSASAESDASKSDGSSTQASSDPLQAEPQVGQDSVATGSDQASSETVSVPVVPEEVGNSVLRLAAEAGDPQALFEVARRYTDGEFVQQNLDTARQWYEVSARAGYAPAQYRLANFMEKGHGGAQDMEKAAMWYQRAAEQGNALAMHNLAVLYAGGLLSSGQDMEAATEWFAKAGELGVKDSQVNLGILYTRGKGVEENLVEAYKWFAIAANGGDADAGQKRDTLANSMRPDQLQTARGLVELWKPAELSIEANSVTPNPAWTTIPGLSTEASPVQLSPKEMVRRSQELLAKLGFDPGPADGMMGNKTRDAIRQYQKQKGLPVDGEVTADLLKKLSGQSA